jgi:hypothetical protein
VLKNLILFLFHPFNKKNFMMNVPHFDQPLKLHSLLPKTKERLASFQKHNGYNVCKEICLEEEDIF